MSKYQLSWRDFQPKIKKEKNKIKFLFLSIQKYAGQRRSPSPMRAG
jgi:hypothetical protein